MVKDKDGQIVATPKPSSVANTPLKSSVQPKETKDMRVNEPDRIVEPAIHPKYTKLNTKKISLNRSNYITQKLNSNHSRTQAYIPSSSETKFEPVSYQPSVLSYKVEQYNDIHFEYTGEPIYTPASANPDKKK